MAKLRMDIHALYASLLVGLCPFHGYNKSSGRTGGFYLLVCHHGVSTEICNWLLFCKSSLRLTIHRMQIWRTTRTARN